MAWAVLGAPRAQFLPCLPTENLRFELENDTGEAIGIGIQPPFSRGAHGIGWDLGALSSFFQELRLELVGLDSVWALQDATGGSP